MPQSQVLFCIGRSRLAPILVSLFVSIPLMADSPPRRLNGTYIATAYAQTGITASGEHTHRHIVAADPKVLPIGTRIKIRHAGKYSGEYVVADTGSAIEGHKLDLYFPSVRECRKFGVRRVKVKVIQLGDGTRAAAEQADKAVKADVKRELEKDAVGDAASEVDWAAKERQDKLARAPNGDNTAPPR